MKIAILHFEDIKAPLTGDGAYFANLAAALTARGHRVETLSLFRPRARVFLWLDRIKRVAYSVFVMTRALKLRQYDAALFTEPLYPQNLLLLRLLKWRAKAPVVLYTNMPGIINALYCAPINKQFPVRISGENARPFAESISSRVSLLPPGVDLNRLRPLETEKSWDFLYFGHLFREKGVLLLLQAMKLVKAKRPSLKLRIVHTPSSEEGSYRAYIARNGLDNVEMEKAVVRDHAALYNSARVFVYPGTSYERVAAVPLTIIEASACGIPVVATTLYRHIALPNITFAGVEAAALADAMIAALDGWNTQKQVRTLAAVRRDFSLEVLGLRAEAFFSSVIDAGNPAKAWHP